MMGEGGRSPSLHLLNLWLRLPSNQKCSAEAPCLSWHDIYWVVAGEITEHNAPSGTLLRMKDGTT